jgi:hypothetical protein
MLNIKREEDAHGDIIFFASGDDDDFVCDLCGLIMDEGYKCESKDLILCSDCQNGRALTEKEKELPPNRQREILEGYDMARRCLHERGEHRHIKFSRSHKEKILSVFKIVFGLF